jgi:hypothetical protein
VFPIIEAEKHPDAALSKDRVFRNRFHDRGERRRGKISKAGLESAINVELPGVQLIASDPEAIKVGSDAHVVIHVADDPLSSRDAVLAAQPRSFPARRVDRQLFPWRELSALGGQSPMIVPRRPEVIDVFAPAREERSRRPSEML